jgi:DNA-binding CsgD family transcriptional regulator
MNTVDLVNERIFAEIRHLCYAGLDPTTLRLRVIEELRKAVPFDAYVAFTTDPTSGLITDMVQEGMGSEADGRYFLEHICFEDDVLEFNWMARNQIPVGLLSEATGGHLDRALRYREVQDPRGLGYELRGAFTTRAELWGALCLSREKGIPDFVARELAFIRRIAPHLGAGLRAATLLQELTNDLLGDDAAGVLILDQRGTVVQHNAAAERWLQELAGTDGGWRDGEALPTPVVAVLGALRMALKADTDRDVNRTPQIRVRGRSGRLLTLQASETEPSPTRSAEQMVIIGPAGPKQVLGLTSIGYGLSAREQEVVDLVVRGASTRQISQALTISEYTVKDHLANIFEKVGVRGRRELIKRLYLHTIFS